MKIYHCVESYYPSVGGMQEVVKQLSERLVTFGHEVIVLTRFHPLRNSETINGVEIIQFKIEGNPFEAIKEEEKKYVQFLLDLKADVITFFAAQQWATDLALPVLKKIQAKGVSVPTGYSGLYKPEYKEYFKKMKEYIHDYDMNIYLSEDYRDINFARENGVSKIVLIPNGAAEEEFTAPSAIDVRKTLGIRPDDFLILHVGSFTGRKGHNELLEIFLRSKLKKAVLLMIGNDHQQFWKQYLLHPSLLLLKLRNFFGAGKRVIFNTFPREFTVAAYRQSDLFLFPSNIECSPIVLFECAAAKLPFISSDAGNSAEISRWTGGGEIMAGTKDKEGFTHVDISKAVSLLEKAYEEKETRKQKGMRAFKTWQEKFTWNVIAKQYEGLYMKLIQ